MWRHSLQNQRLLLRMFLHEAVVAVTQSWFSFVVDETRRHGDPHCATQMGRDNEVGSVVDPVNIEDRRAETIVRHVYTSLCKDQTHRGKLPVPCIIYDRVCEAQSLPLQCRWGVGARLREKVQRVGQGRARRPV